MVGFLSKKIPVNVHIKGLFFHYSKKEALFYHYFSRTGDLRPSTPQVTGITWQFLSSSIIKRRNNPEMISADEKRKSGPSIAFPPSHKG